MKKRFSKLTFSRQVTVFYMAVFLLIFVSCGLLYVVTTARYISGSEDNTLEYGLQMVESNMESLFENINDYSKVIAFDDTVQDVLQRNIAGVSQYDDAVKLQEKVIMITACCDGISSVYLFDNNRNPYIAGNVYETESIQAYLKDTGMDQHFASSDAEGGSSSAIFSYQNESNDMQQVVSYVRLIRHLETMEPLGSLAMNISTNRVKETFAAISEQNGMDVAILDESGKVIIASENGEWLADFVAEKDLKPGKEGYQQVNWTDGKNYKAGMLESKEGNWSIVGAISRKESVKDIQQLSLYSGLILVIGVIICVFGAAFITQRIHLPLKNILTSMEGAKDGELRRVKVIETNHEMNLLQEHYNTMLDETEHLMNQRVEEQRLRRKYELSLLQAQIKPHFLYNTFDSVCALAMMGRTQDVYNMMQALGQYYRNSLNKGKEIITVKEEIDIVRNYLIIQKIRYEDVFEVEYDVDENVHSCPMIKLVLQPFVENAIYHGFREHGLTGTITVRAKYFGDYVMLQVEDDGMGMPQEKVEELLSRTEENQGKRFGMYGTMQRIRLYYHQENRKLFDIRSEIGEGTVVTIWIPKEKGEA